MSRSQYPFPAADPTPSCRTERSWPPPESAWANSVTGPSAIIPPMDAHPLDDADYDDAEPTRPWWLPTAREALAGFLFGATIGALVTAAVALDLADNQAPAAAGPARSAAVVEQAPPRKIEITKPLTAPLHVPMTRAAAAEEPTATATATATPTPTARRVVPPPARRPVRRNGLAGSAP